MAAVNLAQASTGSALKLYSQVPKNGNLIISPTSIQNAIALLERGAQGTTQTQIQDVLGWQKDSAATLRSDAARFQRGLNRNGETTVRNANGIWVANNLQLGEGFKAEVSGELGAKTESVNFEGNAEGVRADINDWIAKVTKYLIQDLIGPNMVNADTIMLLANALYIKGDWNSQFNLALTREGDFLGMNGIIDGVSYMSHHSPQFPFAVDQSNGRKVLELPLKEESYGNDSSVSMFLVLPGPQESLVDFESSLNTHVLSALLASVKYTSLGQLKIPKFTIGSQFSLNDVLQNLGMVDAFSGHADFSRILQHGAKLSVSSSIHGANITINETGLEAGAATAFAMPRGVSFSKADFVANRPFFFVVRDNDNGIPLFMGRVENPNATNETKSTSPVPEIVSDQTNSTVTLPSGWDHVDTNVTKYLDHLNNAKIELDLSGKGILSADKFKEVFRAIQDGVDSGDIKDGSTIEFIEKCIFDRSGLKFILENGQQSYIALIEELGSEAASDATKRAKAEELVEIIIGIFSSDQLATF